MPRVGYWLTDVNIHWGGVGPYTWRILETLLSRLDNVSIEFVVLCHPVNEAACKELIAKCNSKAEACLVPVTWERKLGLVEKINRRIFRKRVQTHTAIPWHAWLASLNLDLLHIPHQTAPPLPIPCPYIITPHDFQELHFPEFFTPRVRAARAEHHCRLLEQCGGVVASFPFVKEDLRKYFLVPEEKIFVCPFPFQKIHFAVPSSVEEASFAQKYAPWPDFLLFPAQTWQHKNHLTLIRAIQHIKEQTGRRMQLVCTGAKYAEFFSVIEKLLAESGVGEQVHFMEVVPEPELHWLYKHCAMVVIPTFYEAGSFPLVEAMFLGVPVICSSVTHLPDTIQDRRFVFDPEDVAGMAQLILRCLDDAEFRQANLANGRMRADELKKIDTFPSILHAWESVLGRR